jgi:hypothetical protein
MQLFVDLDGVLADFDTHYQNIFGALPPKWRSLDPDSDHDVDWNAVTKRGNFYLDMPPMADMEKLWFHVRRYKPIILTGIPSSVPEAAENKRAWVRKHIGTSPRVICCRSREKSLHAQPGDILIDDWEKYKQLWVDMGGIWVTHTSAVDTIAQLDELRWVGKF